MARVRKAGKDDWFKVGVHIVAPTKQKLQEQFLKIWNETRMTVIFVTHDLEEALYMADRVVVMSSHPGRITRIVDVPFDRHGKGT